MSDNSNLVKKDLKFTLPQIQVTHPKTNQILMVATPAPGSLFDLKLPENISKEELVICVADIVEFHYKHCMGLQKRLYDMGWGPEQVGDIFFPGVPSNKDIEMSAETIARKKDGPSFKVVKDDG